MLSIVTPCFNLISERRETIFHKMMESVHNQTYQDIEHILVDNNSNDETLEILKDYQTKGWVTELAHEDKRGIYPAMNAGLRFVRGDYVNIMNTDDYFLDLNYFKDAIEILTSTNSDFIHADRLIKSKTGKPDSIKKGNELHAFFRMPFRHQTMIVKKQIFDEIGLFDENYQVCSDYKWVIKMLLANKQGYYLPRTVVCSLDGGASSNREKCIEEVTKILHEYYGEEYGLNMDDCKAIYLRRISPELLEKIKLNIKNKKIVDSLVYCYESELA